MTVDEVSRVVMWAVGIGITVGGGLISWAIWSLGKKVDATVAAVVTPLTLRLETQARDMHMAIREAVEPLKTVTTLHDYRLKEAEAKLKELDAAKASRAELQSKIAGSPRHQDSGAQQRT